MSDKVTDKKGGSTPTKRRTKRIIAKSSLKATTVQPSAGMTLGNRYELRKELGRGGMGIVFEALDRELDLPVAIKILPPELVHSKRAINGLKRECKLAMTLRHPGIVALYHFAHAEDVKYLVMELLEGETLDDRLADAGKLDVKQVIDIAEQLADALDYAHSQRIVHRDIKPDNIFLHRRDEVERVRIMDFGIARQIKDSLSRMSKMDSAGTLLYMPPEQLKGRAVDARSDVYALGSTLYECLCGHPPFHQGSISYQIVNELPPTIDSAPEHVNRALLKALAKLPEDRFPSAGALFLALADCDKTTTQPNLINSFTAHATPPTTAPHQTEAPATETPIAEATDEPAEYVGETSFVPDSKPKSQRVFTRRLALGCLIACFGMVFLAVSCGVIVELVSGEDVCELLYDELVGTSEPYHYEPDPEPDPEPEPAPEPEYTSPALPPLPPAPTYNKPWYPPVSQYAQPTLTRLELVFTLRTNGYCNPPKVTVIVVNENGTVVAREPAVQKLFDRNNAIPFGVCVNVPPGPYKVGLQIDTIFKTNNGLAPYSQVFEWPPFPVSGECCRMERFEVNFP